MPDALPHVAAGRCHQIMRARSVSPLDGFVQHWDWAAHSSFQSSGIRAMTQQPQFVARSITDIALSWGYNSPAHFSRVFRKQFGATPSEWRARALPAAD